MRVDIKYRRCDFYYLLVYLLVSVRIERSYSCAKEVPLDYAEELGFLVVVQGDPYWAVVLFVDVRLHSNVNMKKVELKRKRKRENVQ